MFPQTLLSYKTVENRQYENIESKEVADLQRFYPKKRIDVVAVPQMVLNRRNFGWDAGGRLAMISALPSAPPSKVCDSSAIKASTFNSKTSSMATAMSASKGYGF